MLTKNDILQNCKLAWTGDVPGVGEVGVRELSGDDVDFICGTDRDGTINHQSLFARLVTVALCDEDARPLFKRSDLQRVNEMPMKTLRALAEVCKEHSGFLQEDEDELLGNSETITPSDSGTA